MRVLIAGVGNVLRGDDGFGVEVLHRLGPEVPAEVELFESGIAGIGLVQQLLEGYDALILLDALDRGAEPGTLFVLEPERTPATSPGGPAAIDLHQAGPEGVLRLAAALGVLPSRVWIVGCQAADWDELGVGLSEPVRRAVPAAVRQVADLLATLGTARSGTDGRV